MVRYNTIEISIHAPLAGRDPITPPKGAASAEISIHAPLAGRDQCCSCYPMCRPEFQSTRPLRGATVAAGDVYTSHIISIHAPLAGRDKKVDYNAQRLANFNPRAPCGARRFVFPRRLFTWRISIHAPLAGCDSKSAQKNAALLRKRYKYKFFVCKKCTSGDLTGAYSSKNTLYSGANCSENPCALSVRTHRISGPSTSNPGLMPKCSILERYFSPR